MELLNVFDGTHKLFKEFGKINNESVLKVTGQVVSRSNETINKNLIQERLK